VLKTVPKSSPLTCPVMSLNQVKNLCMLCHLPLFWLAGSAFPTFRPSDLPTFRSFALRPSSFSHPPPRSSSYSFPYICLHPQAVSCGFQVGRTRNLLSALDWLHNMGDIWHANSYPELRELVILDPEWLLAVCKGRWLSFLGPRAREA
jgi:hypothetical protein